MEEKKIILDDGNNFKEQKHVQGSLHMFVFTDDEDGNDYVACPKEEWELFIVNIQHAMEINQNLVEELELARARVAELEGDLPKKPAKFIS